MCEKRILIAEAEQPQTDIVRASGSSCICPSERSATSWRCGLAAPDSTRLALELLHVLPAEPVQLAVVRDVPFSLTPAMAGINDFRETDGKAFGQPWNSGGSFSVDCDRSQDPRYPLLGQNAH